MTLAAKRFDEPDEVRPFELGRMEVVTVGGHDGWVVGPKISTGPART